MPVTVAIQRAAQSSRSAVRLVRLVIGPVGLHRHLRNNLLFVGVARRMLSGIVGFAARRTFL
eukprot:4922615-Alexandrium_andersonii.AAC.1